MAPRTGFPTDGLVDQLGYKRETDLHISNSWDHDDWTDGFFGDGLDAKYPASKTNGTSAAVTLTEHSVNGFLKLISGTDNDGYAGQGFGMNWTGDRGVLFQSIITTPATITAWKWENGVSDNDQDAGAVLQKAATTTATATDFGVFVYDTDDDTNIAFVSAKGGTVSTTQDIEALAASTTYRLAIRVTNDDITAYINGTVVAEHANSIEGGNGLTPWVFSQARSAASRTLQLDRWGMNQPAY